ncbi:MAG: fibronectin type III domain-containing protein [Phycisphaerales bacterium]|nr:fibronectin type III domain-containing protein [Phycisphaerales bacterium]
MRSSGHRQTWWAAGVISMLSACCWAQFPVAPYLQKPTPTSMAIAWESDGHDESWIDFGLTPEALDQTASGNWVTGADGTHIHHVELSGLSSFTRYYYRARTEQDQSEIAWFTTPLPVGSEAPFTFVAYSDSQQGNIATKHGEIINEGILDYFGQPGGGDIDQVISFSLVPGDLVGVGSNHSHWQDDFFGQASNLYRHVPLYPALGNHESNADLYYGYMNLPLNGSLDYPEQWYWFDHHNLRVITLDSNPPFDNAAQLAWFDGVLADACTAEHIDFLLVQFHHPHLSESWTPGESDFSSEAVARAEQFTADCGKPSVHFFGHTHSYSRGQSRDHQHLMVNVASAMGSLDYWYLYDNEDYDEFQVTENEWGFCVIEIVGGENPTLTLTRVSRGNDYISRDNEIRDQVSIRYQNDPPTTPTAVSPSLADGPVLGWEIDLVGDTFADGDGDDPLESHWQISTDLLDWSTPVAEDWKRRENWYRPSNGDGWYSVNTVTDPEVSRTTIDGDVPGCSTLYWRVRYRDDGLQWSDWSAPLAFSTGESFGGEDAPTPEDGEEDISREPVLTWGNCSGASSWDVYLGLTPALGAEDLLAIVPEPSLAIGPLAPQTTYYWRVDATIDGDVLEGPTWSFTTTRRFPTDWTAEWRLIDESATTGEPLVAARGTAEMIPDGMIEGLEWSLGATGGGVPDINETPATFIRVDNVSGANSGLRLWLDAPGNNGDIETYTWAWDLYIEPGQVGRIALWQGSHQNTNQSELQLDCDTGGFWVNGTGFVGENLWSMGEWFRLVQRVDYAKGTSALFVNGEKVLDDTVLGAPDWVWGGGSEYSTWLFTDDDGAETGLVRCSSVAFVDDLMTDLDIADLGEANAYGIFLDRPTEWRFNDMFPADDDAMETAFGTGELVPTGMVYGLDWVTSDTGTVVPDINGDQASYISMDNVWGSNRGLRVFTNMPGNAGLGCCDLGHFTMAWDLYFHPKEMELQALWQANANNANDAELFVDCGSGGFYVGGQGYVGADLWPLAEWFRVVHRVDYVSNTSTLFVNGELVLDNLPAPDWIYGADSGNPIWFLSDDGSGSDVSLVQCSTMGLIDRLLTDQEIQALGGPDASGIFDPPVGDPCPADINNDDVVSVKDVLRVIADWGICSGCATDVDGSNVVDVNDLLIVISAWGEC